MAQRSLSRVAEQWMRRCSEPHVGDRQLSGDRQLLQRAAGIPALSKMCFSVAERSACCAAVVVLIPARLPITVEATEDGVDVWIAGVNPQAFKQGEPSSKCFLTI